MSRLEFCCSSPLAQCPGRDSPPRAYAEKGPGAFPQSKHRPQQPMGAASRAARPGARIPTCPKGSPALRDENRAGSGRKAFTSTAGTPWHLLSGTGFPWPCSIDLIQWAVYTLHQFLKISGPPICSWLTGLLSILYLTLSCAGVEIISAGFQEEV